jgi:hypothetical protein
MTVTMNCLLRGGLTISGSATLISAKWGGTGEVCNRDVRGNLKSSGRDLCLATRTSKQMECVVNRCLNAGSVRALCNPGEQLACACGANRAKCAAQGVCRQWESQTYCILLSDRENRGNLVDDGIGRHPRLRLSHKPLPNQVFHPSHPRLEYSIYIERIDLMAR